MKTVYTAIIFVLLMTDCFGQSFSYPTNATLRWKLPLAGASFALPAVGPDGIIYVMQDAYPGPNLWAINPNGTTNWESTLYDGTVSVPVVGSDGNLYIFATTNFGNFNLFALNLADGSTNWFYVGDSASEGSDCLMPALGADGTVYFCTSAGAIDAVTNGVLEWSALSDIGLADGSPVVGPDGTIYAFADDSPLQFYALSADGSLKWSTNYPGVSFPAYPPAIAADGTIYFSGGQYFCAVNPADGSFKWEFSAANFAFNFENPEVGPNGTIYIEAVSDSANIATAYTNLLYALAPNGTVEWTFPLPQYYSAHPPSFHESSCAIAADGEIYVTTTAGTVYSIAPNGTMNWSFHTNSTGLHAPVIGPDGTVYVDSYDNANLFAFYGPAPVACSAWPQFNKNSRHVTAAATAYLSSLFMRTNGFQFNITGTSNQPVCSCASSDLVNWTNIGRIVLTNGTASFVDAQSSNFPHRFYRALPQ